MFLDTTSKLSACFADVEFLTEFTSVFIYDIWHAQFRYLILEREAVPNGITISVDNPERNLWIELCQKLSQLAGNSRTWCSQKVCREVDYCFRNGMYGRLLFIRGNEDTLV